MLKKPLVLFILGVALMSVILFLFPLNLFDGEVHFDTGKQQFTEPIKLSLSYFIGIGIKTGDLKDVSSFNLTKSGYVLAFILIIGFPALLAYRMHLKRNHPKH